MYFWRTDQLIEDIKLNKLSEENFKNYYVFGSIFLFLTLFILSISPAENFKMSLALFVVNIGMLISFTNAIFKANGGVKGQHFLNRLVALYVPISIKIFCVFILIYIGFEIFLKLSNEYIDPILLDKLNTHKADVIDLLYALIVYWRIYVAIKKINSSFVQHN